MAVGPVVRDQNLLGSRQRTELAAGPTSEIGKDSLGFDSTGRQCCAFTGCHQWSQLLGEHANHRGTVGGVVPDVGITSSAAWQGQLTDGHHWCRGRNFADNRRQPEPHMNHQ